MPGFPLKGVRVADFTWQGAGPFTTKHLADHGADVIRIESSRRLDGLRSGRPFRDGIPGVNRSGYFANRNSNKRTILLDLKHPKGHEIALRLIAQSDVVANNFGRGTMEKLGLGYEDCRRVKPDIIYLVSTVNGSEGPDADEIGSGVTVVAMAGLTHLGGRPDMKPVGTGTSYSDHVTVPSHSAFAVLAALRHRRRTGRGQLIDVAQVETTTVLLGPIVMDYTVNGNVQTRNANRVSYAAPHGVYPCAGPGA
ncbi:MAG: CoA transferase, partial [Betaproteobacteria bacterium]|nr:CoA transferase [Betaproteobacteria bacterium]